MKKILSRTILLIIIILNSSLLFAQHKLEKIWETDSVLKVPESVLFDGDKKVLYASNIDGTDPWGKDGKGSIAKVGLDGKVIATEWVSGLNAPKGMGLYKGKLYVADLNEIVVIDIAGSKIEKKIAVTGAEGLNDVSVSNKGIVYVSDSKLKKIFTVKDGVSELLLDTLKGPNGVLMRGDDFYLLDAGGMFKMNKDKTLTRITDGMEGGTDGIENISGNDFIVSCWQGVVWYVNADGSKQQLLDSRADKKNSADIGMDAKNKIIYVPTFWRNTIVAYRVK
ncbi:MAG: ATP/GTP-binding protein [Bacteroidetes bacterium]|nr:MAG: ATP/GTP-binding protein [Bacteroidota bacterium]